MRHTSVGKKIVDHLDVDRRCSNYIFLPDLTHGFNGMGKDNCETRRETLEVLGFGVPYIKRCDSTDNPVIYLSPHLVKLFFINFLFKLSLEFPREEAISIQCA